MYEKPKLERFGTFRELTQSGTQSNYDLAGILNNNAADSCDPSKDCYILVSPSHS